MAYLKPQTPLKDLNSGDYFYPLTTIDQVQKSDGSRVQDYELGNVALEDSETAPGPGTPQMTTLMNMVYPIGSIYMSVNATSPASLFGGTWEQIQDRFLLAAGSTYNAGSTGGSATHTHTIAHTHTMAHTHDISHTHTMAHTHTLSHTHNVTAKGSVNNTTLTINQIPSHSHAIYNQVDNYSGTVIKVGSGNSALFYWTNNDRSTLAAGGGGAHNHGFSGSAVTSTAASNTTTSAASNATTSAASTSTSGAASNATTSAASNANSGSASTLPPYLTVYMWKRTA